MYLNVICLKSGKTIPFRSEIPYSVDKVEEGWNVLTDEVNHQYISVRGAEIASICSQTVRNDKAKETNDRKQKAAKMAQKKAQSGKPKFTVDK